MDFFASMRTVLQNNYPIASDPLNLLIPGSKETMRHIAWQLKKNFLIFWKP